MLLLSFAEESLLLAEFKIALESGLASAGGANFVKCCFETFYVLQYLRRWNLKFRHGLVCSIQSQSGLREPLKLRIINDLQRLRSYLRESCRKLMSEYYRHLCEGYPLHLRGHAMES